MKKIKLGVNIDHVATLRNARNDNFPNLLSVVKVLHKVGADSVTVHLREDRRHIKDKDIRDLKNQDLLPINLEMAATHEMNQICLNTNPFSCCIVPERREELTTEGGLDVKNQMNYLSNYLPSLIKKTKVSLFIDPDLEQIKASADLGVHAVELHTGKYSNLYKKNNYKNELKKIQRSAEYCNNVGLVCHAGHGLNFENVVDIAQIDEVVELNVGHFLIGDSLFSGLENTILKFMKIINHPKSK